MVDSTATDEVVRARIQSHGDQWADTVIAALGTAWPHSAGHQATGPDDVDVTPHRLHPAFHGSLDWHSSVHMQWSALRLASSGLVQPERAEHLLGLLDGRLGPEQVRAEVAYLRAHPGFERPYGWGWALALVAEARAVVAEQRPGHEQARTWLPGLDELGAHLNQVLVAWLANLAYPVRHGTHANTAFTLALARDAQQAPGGDPGVVEAIDRAALGWFGNDVDYPSTWEPSGADFLSPALTEADLLRRVLGEQEFGPWLRTFLPVLGEPGDNLLDLPTVLDHTDGHAVHLFGLALSRSSALRHLAPWLTGPARERALESSARQFAWAAPHITEGSFMSTHWLVSLALL